MSQNIIGIGFDWQQTEADKAKIVAAMKEVLDNGAKLENLRLPIGNYSAGVGEFKKILSDLADTQRDLTKAVTDFTTKVQRSAKASSSSSKQTKQAVDDLTKARQNLAKANSLENEQLQGYKVQTAEANKAAKEQAKVTLGLVDAYQMLEKEYQAAQKEAKALAAVYGVNSKEAKAAAASALALNTELKAIDASVGQNQRNVGNYTSAFGKFYGYIRQAANILPGVGISGIFLLMFEGIKKAAEALGLFTSKATDAELATKALSDALGTHEYKNAVIQFQELSVNVALAKEGFLNKNEVLKQYNDTIGKTVGHANNLDEAEQLLVQNGAAYIKMTLFKAAANTALEEASKKAVKAAQDNLKQAEDFLNTGDKLVAFGAKNAAATPGGGYIPGLQEQADQQAAAYRKSQSEKRKKDAIKQSEDEQKTYEKIATDFQKKAAEIAKDNKFDFFGGKETEKDQKDRLEDMKKARLDALKAELDEEAKLRQGFADSDSFYYTQRIVEAKKASDLRLQILDLEAQQEKNKKDISNEELLEIDKKYNVKRRQEVLATQIEINKLTADAVKKNKAEQDKLYNEVNAQNPLTTDAAINSKLKVRVDEELQIYKNGATQQLEILATTYTQKETALLDQHNKGLISEKDYQYQLVELQKQATKESLDLTIKSANEQLVVLQKAGLTGTKQYDDLKKVIADANKQAAQLGATLPRLGDNAGPALKKLEDLFRKIANTINDISSLAVGAFSASIENQKNNVQDLEDAQQASYEKEVENINNSTLAEQDKANKLKVLESTRQAQKDANERKQRQLDQERARFEKAATITKIIAETALAVVHQLASGDWVTAIPRAIAAGALGAAQLAVAIATPIPKFAKGTKNAPGGWALTDEEGPELYIEPSGKTYLGNDSPTLRHLTPGTEIISNKELLRMGMGNAMRGQLNLMDAYEKSSKNKDWDIARWQADKIERAMNRQQTKLVNKIVIHNDADYNLYLNKKVFHRK